MRYGWEVTEVSPSDLRDSTTVSLSSLGTTTTTTTTTTTAAAATALAMHHHAKPIFLGAKNSPD
jgi:hypothetical protein